MKRSVREVRRHAGSTSWATRRALTGAVLLVSLAACGGTPSASNAGGTTLAAGEASGSVNVPELLQFTAPLVGGGEFNGADRGGRATAFWFWAPT